MKNFINYIEKTLLLLGIPLMILALSCEGCPKKKPVAPETPVEQETIGEEALQNIEYYRNILRTEWGELKGKIKEEWGKLTDDELTQIQGNWEQLVAALQLKYYENKKQAEEAVKNFLDKLAKQKENVQGEGY